MQTVISDARSCTPSELIAEVAKADPREFITALAEQSSELERTANDGALYSRLAIEVLGLAFVEAAAQPRFLGAVPQLSLDDLFRMANGIPSRDRAIEITGSELHESNCRMMVRLFAQHEACLGPLKPALGRTEILLNQIMPSILDGRANPLDVLPQAIGTTFQDARAVLLAMFGWIIASSRVAPPVVTPHVLSTTKEPDRFWRTLNAFAATQRELYETRVAHPAYGCPLDENFRYSFSILRDRPLVRFDDGSFATPLARYLGLAFCNGIYDFLAAHLASGSAKAKEDFDNIFGDVTDAYVRERFRRELGSGAYVPLPVLKGGELSPDGIAGAGDCVFELKGKRLLRGMLTTGDLNAAPRFIGGKRGLGRAAAQLLSEIARTRTGKGRGLSVEHLDEVVPCLITPDGLPGFHLAPVRRWLMRAFDRAIRKSLSQ